jgi:PAS domain S-box-containing protein
VRPNIGGNLVWRILSALLILILIYILTRQFRNYALRTKLILTLLGATLTSILVIGFTIYRIANDQITKQTGENLASIANGNAREISSSLDNSIVVLQTFAFNKFMQDTLQAASANGTSDPAVFKRLDEQWARASNEEPIIRAAVGNSLADELREFQNAYPDYSEIFATDKFGALVAATNRTSDYYQADEAWWQTTWNNGTGAIYVGQPEFDESSKTISVNMAIPVRAQNSPELIGVLRFTLNITGLTAMTDAVKIGETGRSVLIFGSQIYGGGKTGLTPVEPAAMARLAALEGKFGETNFEGVPSLVTIMPVSAHLAQHGEVIDRLGWKVIVHQTINESQQPVDAISRSISLTVFFVTLVIILVAWGLAQLIATPLVHLTAVAQKVAAGDFNAQAEVTSGDEIGSLATTFNNMTAQLRDLIRSLEQQVENRTRALAAATEVSRRISTILNPRQLLVEAVEQVKAAFGYYHAHIYLLDEAGQNLVLTAGAGEPGRLMLLKGFSIPLNREHSLVARAARERRSVNIDDVTQTPDFLPNPYLPNTRSELAVPLLIGDQVLGVFDVQSDQVGRFTEGEINIQNSLAAQISATVQNGRQYMESLQFKLGIERSGDAVFVTNPKGVIIYANPAFEKTYGYKPAEAIGQNPRIIKSGLLSHDNYAAFWGALLSKNSVTGEIINKHRDGHLVYVAGTNSAIVDDSGEIIGFLAVHHDISETRQAQEALAKRAAELATVAEVGTAASSVLNIDQLLQKVVDLAKERLKLYHAHIYLLDETGQNLVLAAGAGEAGRQMTAKGHSIPLNRERSLVARCAREEVGVTVNDVTLAPDFMQNPYLPDTRSELAVPLIVGEQLIGVFDAQSDLVGHFTEADINIQTTMATQVAVAVQNARILAQAQRQAGREATLNAIIQKIQGATTVESAMKIAARELGRALGRKPTLVTLDPAVLSGEMQVE